MDIKDLLASFAEIDEMEAPDGMNIAETEEMISNSELQYSYNVSVTIDAENALDNKFLKENINLTQCFKRYNQIGIICVIGILLCSIFETFVMPILMNLFL